MAYLSTWGGWQPSPRTTFQHISHLLDDGDRHMASLYANACIFGHRHSLFHTKDLLSNFSSPCIRRPLYQLSQDCKHNKIRSLSLCLWYLGLPTLDGLVAGLHPSLHYECKRNSRNRAGLPSCRVIGFKEYSGRHSWAADMMCKAIGWDRLPWSEDLWQHGETTSIFSRLREGRTRAAWFCTGYLSHVPCKRPCICRNIEHVRSVLSYFHS